MSFVSGPICRDRRSGPRNRPRCPSARLPSGALGGGGRPSPAQHRAANAGPGQEVGPLPGDPQHPGKLQIFGQPVGPPGKPHQAPGRETHSVALEADCQPHPILPQKPDPVEQAEGVGHHPGPPRGIRVAHGVVALDPVLPLAQRRREGGQDPRIDDRIRVDHDDRVGRARPIRAGAGKSIPGRVPCSAAGDRSARSPPPLPHGPGGRSRPCSCRRSRRRDNARGHRTPLGSSRSSRRCSLPHHSRGSRTGTEPDGTAPYPPAAGPRTPPRRSTQDRRKMARAPKIRVR